MNGKFILYQKNKNVMHVILKPHTYSYMESMVNLERIVIFIILLFLKIRVLLFVCLFENRVSYTTEKESERIFL